MNDKIKQALELRKELKDKKPSFIRQDAHKKPKLSRTAYRRPRGLQSKMRLQKKGYRKIPSSGYSSPSLVRNLTRDGLKPFIVSNLKELDRVDSKTEGVIVSATVGMKKRIEIVKLAIEKKITVINIDVQTFIKNAEESFKNKKSSQDKKEKARTEKRSKKEKDASKKDDTKSGTSTKNGTSKEQKDESVEDKITDEDKKDKEKKEKDKILQSKTK